MKTQPGLHNQLLMAKKAINQKLPAVTADPFACLSAFVQGTGDLFDSKLVDRIADICSKRDIKRYIELSSEIDGYTEIYVDEDPELVKGHRVLCSLLKKYPFSAVETPFKPRDAAIDKWYAAEAQCLATNQRLGLLANGDLPEFVHVARRLIADCLGDLSPARIMKMLREGEHGKGTSTECPFKASTVYHKYKQTAYHSTTRALNYAKAAISLNRRWYDHLERSGVRRKVPLPHSSGAYAEEQLLSDVIGFCESERISFVEKDAKSMRPIGIGNTLNMYMQLGVKRTMTECLRNVGVDLSDQTKNQQLALLGSQLGSMGDGDLPVQHSTIDLASASDTVSIGICKLLLPSDWFGLLSDLRHESGVLDGKTIVYSKMSAMGNGFTFPLESLLFWAIAKATAEVMGRSVEQRDLAVYGDDIICPSWMYPQLTGNLEWSGFTVNTEKSFYQGPFKESCGADYYQGINVRPYYLKRRLTTVKDLYYVANAILPWTLDCSSQVSNGYKALYRHLAKAIRTYGPVNYRPLSDVLHIDEEGNRHYHDSDQGLCVPYKYFIKYGHGHFSVRDKVELFNKRWFGKVSKRWRNAELSGLISSNLPYVLQRTDRSKPETNVCEALRLLTRLQSCETVGRLLDRYDDHDIRYSVANNGTTSVVRKEPQASTFRLRPVPNWDGYASKGLVTRHPVW